MKKILLGARLLLKRAPKGLKMTEQNDVWKANQGNTTHRCPKYDIIITGCSLHYECEECIKGKRRLKNVPKETKKHRKKSSTSNLGDSTVVKKRGRKSRNGDVCGPIRDEKPVKIPKTGNKRKVRRRSRSLDREEVKK